MGARFAGGWLMVTRVIRTEADIEALRHLLRARELPATVTITKGESRTGQQNKLSWQWFVDIATQLGDRLPEDVRKHCKLHHGVPILRAENEAFRVQYDSILKPLPYEVKIAAMGEPVGFPVTSLMTTKQQTAYLDAISREFSAQGVRLTDPEALKYAGMM